VLAPALVDGAYAVAADAAEAVDGNLDGHGTGLLGTGGWLAASLAALRRGLQRARAAPAPGRFRSRAPHRRAAAERRRLFVGGPALQRRKLGEHLVGVELVVLRCRLGLRRRDDEALVHRGRQQRVAGFGGGRLILAARGALHLDVEVD